MDSLTAPTASPSSSPTPPATAPAAASAAHPLAPLAPFDEVDPVQVAEHLRVRLAAETDPSDTWEEIRSGATDLVLIDARSPEAFADGHLPGAVNLWHRSMNSDALGLLDPGRRYVVYCAGPGCNASTKGAMRLASAGLQVREMLGGLEYWERYELPVEGRD